METAMKTTVRTLAQAMIIAFVSITLIACDPENNPLFGHSGNGNGNSGNGNSGTQNEVNPAACLDSIPMSELSETEAAGLLFMIEEEKMAHDVYVKLFEKFGQKTFDNIQKSETSHSNAIAALLTRYSLVNPIAGKAIGDFQNEAIANLYAELLNMSNSLTDGLSVGALIEETDIADLDKEVAKTDNADIQAVYDNLRKGSENHLRAFVRTLSNNGVAYSPKILSTDEYNRIIAN